MPLKSCSCSQQCSNRLLVVPIGFSVNLAVVGPKPSVTSADLLGMTGMTDMT